MLQYNMELVLVTSSLYTLIPVNYFTNNSETINLLREKLPIFSNGIDCLCNSDKKFPVQMV